MTEYSLLGEDTVVETNAFSHNGQISRFFNFKTQTLSVLHTAERGIDYMTSSMQVLPFSKIDPSEPNDMMKKLNQLKEEQNNAAKTIKTQETRYELMGEDTFVANDKLFIGRQDGKISYIFNFKARTLTVLYTAERGLTDITSSMQILGFSEISPEEIISVGAKMKKMKETQEEKDNEAKNAPQKKKRWPSWGRK